MPYFGSKTLTRGFQHYWRFARGLTMGAQGVVLDGDNRVLLIRHTYRPGWHFPGGGVEKDETAFEAVTREVGEEAGVIVGERPRLFSLYANFKFFPSDHIALFVIRDWRQPKVPEPNREIAEIGMFAPSKLPEGTIEPVRRRLGEILDGRPPELMW